MFIQIISAYRPALKKFDSSLKGTISKATRDERCPKSVVKNYKYLHAGMKSGYDYLCGKGLDSKFERNLFNTKKGANLVLTKMFKPPAPQPP